MRHGTTQRSPMDHNGNGSSRRGHGHPLDAELERAAGLTGEAIEVSPDSMNRPQSQAAEHGHHAPIPVRGGSIARGPARARFVAEQSTSVKDAAAAPPATKPNHQQGGPAAAPAPGHAAGHHAGKIRPLDQRLGAGVAPTEQYKRRPTADGTGACRVKSFHCRLTGDSLDFLDDQINAYLDEHPELEVKFVTSTVGEWTGKSREPVLILNLWM